MKKIKMLNGRLIPAIGMGTWSLNGKECVETIGRAIELGYRHFDTAEMYGNEEPIGMAIKKSGIDRDYFFITTKVWPDHLKAKDLKKAVDGSLNRLGLDYVDLILIHWPNPSIPLDETINALNDVYNEGKTWGIGVSNFSKELLQKAMQLSPIPIVCNQVLYNYEQHDKELYQFCKDNGIVLCAYAPLGRGVLAKKLGAKWSLLWLMEQDGICAIPMSRNEQRLKQNLEAGDENN